MDLELLDVTVRALGEAPFRARQVWEWTARGASSFGEMRNLPAALRQALEARALPAHLALGPSAVQFRGWGLRAFPRPRSP